MLEMLPTAVLVAVLLFGSLPILLAWRRYPGPESILVRIPMRGHRLFGRILLATGYAMVGLSLLAGASSIINSGPIVDPVLYLAGAAFFLLATRIGLRTCVLCATDGAIHWGYYRIPWNTVRAITHAAWALATDLYKWSGSEVAS